MSPDPRVRIVLDLFDNHYDAVLRFARRSVDASTAEDVSQEVFARLLRLPDLESKVINASYLLKIAENLIRRRHQRNRRFAESALQFRAVSADAPGRQEPMPREEPARTREAVSTLAECERQAVDLVVCRGLSYRQAAESMGVKVSDVNNWRHRGVEKLRRHVEGGRYERAE